MAQCDASAWAMALGGVAECRGAMRREALRLVWCRAKEAPHK